MKKKEKKLKQKKIDSILNTDKFEIQKKYPISLKFVDSLIISSNGEFYSIPTKNIQQTVANFDENSLLKVNKIKLKYKYLGEYIPVFQLSYFFTNEFTEIENPVLIILKNESLKYGILVDDIESKDKILIKKIGNINKQTNNYILSVTTLEHNKLINNLDINKLFDKLRKL